MGDRKVLQKYYPPDFDPAKLPRNRGKYQVRSKKHLDKESGRDQITVRMALPFTLRCSTCGEYMGRGRKFNSRKEVVKERNYRGIKIFRFYQRCTRCSSEFTFCTDPENMDYAAEHGAARHFEPWKDEAGADDGEAEGGDDGGFIDNVTVPVPDADDALRALEERTAESRAEMAELDALDDLRGRNAQREARRANSTTGASGKSVDGTLVDAEAAADAADAAELEAAVRAQRSRVALAAPKLPLVGTGAAAAAAAVGRGSSGNSGGGGGGGDRSTRTAGSGGGGGGGGTMTALRTLPKADVARRAAARAKRPAPKPTIVVRPRVIARATATAPRGQAVPKQTSSLVDY
jgi:uncharacterized membrane protein YgcG